METVRRARLAAVAAALAVLPPDISTAAAFAPAARPAASSPSALRLSDGGPSPPPFFAAAPAFGSPDASAPAAPQPATVTLRLPLGTLFDGRDYTFVTYSNVRGYEWTEREAGVLMDDLMDAALGNLGGAPADGAVGGTGAAAHQSQPPPAPVADYELSQVVLVPTSDWDSSLLGLGNRYDVYDGQQRLVTLSLLLAGLRDSFRSEADGLFAGKGGGKRAVALAATAGEIGGMLAPSKVRKEDVVRIALRKRDDVLLSRILVGDGSTSVRGDDENVDDDDDEADVAAATPTEAYSKLTSKEKSTLLSSLSPTNARIFHNFVHLADRIASLTTRERLRLLDYVVERVHLLVCIPETSRIARNIVMSQGRKGMDNEPIDDFKGLVCFRYTLEEEDMYRTFDRWDALAAEPSSSLSSTSGDGSAGVDATGAIAPVGRDTVASACLLRASASLRTKIRGRGGDEVYEWERWIRREAWLKNQQQQAPNGQQQEAWQGKDFFEEEIAPAAVALYKFRNGLWDDFSFLSGGAGAGRKRMTKRKRAEAVSRLEFLRDATACAASAKEAEIAVLELLLRAEGGGATPSRLLDEHLPRVEAAALWMALTRPSPMRRHARALALLDAMEGLDPGSALGGVAGTAESLRECLDGYEFGATAGGRRLAAAILKRMNAHLIIEAGKGVPRSNKAVTASVEPIQLDWLDEDERDEWAHRIGNLALVSSTQPRGGRKGKKGAVNPVSFESKLEVYKKEPWPLTRQLAELDQCDADVVRDQQKELVSFMDIVWSLDDL